jgi:ribulose-bisphosphate carboxylase large chain
MGYIDYEYEAAKDDIVCKFYIEPRGGGNGRKKVEHVSEEVAAESSIGTWTDICTMDKKSAEKLHARVFEIKGNEVKIAYPFDLFEKDSVPEIMSSIGGNIFGMKALENIRLQDIYFPKKMLRSFKGPAFGMEGIRKLLGVKKRPLVGTIVKPKVGLNYKQHAKVAYDAWSGGIDVVKDDENLTNQVFNPFDKRIIETLKMRDKAEQETGEKKVYMPNTTAETFEMIRRAEFVKAHGGRYAMIDILTCGWSGLQSLRDAQLGLALHAHRAGHATFTRNKKHGISMLVIAKLARMIGVDQIHIGTIVGKMEGGAQEIIDMKDQMLEQKIAEHGDVLAQEWAGLKSVFPVSSGGMYPGIVPPLIDYLGNNIIIQAGGGCHGHPAGTRAGATALRQAIDATLESESLKDYAKTHEELAGALKKWGC